MPKPTKGARLGGSPAHQRLILKNLAKALFEHTAIETTEVRAKRLQPYAERLIAKAIRGDQHSRRQIISELVDRSLVAVLVEQTAPKFGERKGGYTRIIKIGNRKGDNAPMARIELVLEPLSPKQAVVKEAEAAAKSAAKTQKKEETVDETSSEATVNSDNSSEETATPDALVEKEGKPILEAEAEATEVAEAEAEEAEASGK